MRDLEVPPHRGRIGRAMGCLLRSGTRARRVAVFVAIAMAVGCGISRTGGPRPDAGQVEPEGRRRGLFQEAESPIAFSGGDTYAVIVGVLRWQSPGLAPFSGRNRKDRELHDVLLGRGVPANQTGLLLDEAATRDAMWRVVDEMLARAGPGSTLLFYYAGHGLRDGAGSVYLANYDVGSDPGTTGFSVSGLAERIATRFRGRRVVVMADCCFSGSLQRVAHAAAGPGRETVALTSADTSNASTQNWTFTQTVIDVLQGDPLADRDGDGRIVIEEVAAEVADAMMYRENQRSGFTARDVSRDWPWAKVPCGPAEGERVKEDEGNDVPRSGGYALARSDLKWEPVRIRGCRSEKRLVRFYRYSDATDRLVEPHELRPIEFRRYPVGASLGVYWGGQVWDAEVLKVDGDFHLVHYPGWESFWDEWVLSDRIAGSGPASDSSTTGDRLALATGDRVEVEWRGRWWPAVVQAVRQDRALIHYEDHEASWDEWVLPSRVRPR
jgi:hypothetical protein